MYSQNEQDDESNSHLNSDFSSECNELTHQYSVIGNGEPRYQQGPWS